jgi:Tol biopolymer transport system component
MRKLLGVLAVALGVMAGMAGLASPLSAQAYFGKNQVQYDHFDWKVLETEHFRVHFYPAEAEAAHDAARIAERAYGRLSRVFQHEFREKKPILLFSSRMDFAQNNVTGDLGEGTGGVTDAQRHRIMMPFTGDYGSFEQILTHEMVHEFQYDIFANGKAGNGLQTLAQVNPPLWFAEGMAEYLSIGPVDPQASTVMRDAALNGRIPTIEQMTLRPDLFNPYDVGQAFWKFIGEKWGDQTIGAIMQAAPNVGIERAFRREIGKSLDDLGDEWKEYVQVTHLPQIASLQRARKFSSQLLSERKSGGAVFLAPALSDDGNYIAFLSNGNPLRGEVFIDLWLGDARTGKRIKRLVKSTLNPDAEELRIIYSQSSFSPDAKHLAYVGQRKGRDVLYVLDVAKQETVRRLELPLEGVTGPAWSPDGSKIVFSGLQGGLTDLYIVDADGHNLKRLTNDRHGDMQPSWSPDGKTIAFATDRGPDADFGILELTKFRIALYHLETGRIEVLPNQSGQNINPQWAPDGKSIAFVSGRTGIQNIFLYDFTDGEQYQLTNVIGGVTAVTQYSPAISWARQADRLAYTYYEDGNYTVWVVDNPRLLKKEPYRETAPSVVAAAGTASDSAGVSDLASTLPDTALVAPLRTSYYRTSAGFRASSAAPAAGERTGGADPVTVAQLLDSASLALPDTSEFKIYDYKTHFSPDYIARPTIGYARDNYGRGVYGGTTIILSDLLGNSSLAFSGQVNGRLSDASAFAAYTNLSHRIQYTTGVYQEPYFFAQGYSATPTQSGVLEARYLYLRYIQRQAFGIGIYPINRFTRFEFGTRLTSVGRSDYIVTQPVNSFGQPLDRARLTDIVDGPTVNYLQPFVAHVSDNVLFGYTGPIMGRRYRFQVQPTFGNYQFMDYLADYRRYDPVIFNFFTIASRGMLSLSSGRDADSLRKFIGYPDILRGYDRQSFQVNPSNCSQSSAADSYRCLPLFGSRVAVASVEARFPLFRRIDVGIIPISLPPLEAVAFYDAGLTWFGGQKVTLKGDAGNPRDPSLERTLLRSYGFGVRLNLFNFALLRWDYAIPLDGPNRKNGYWRFSLGPSF